MILPKKLPIWKLDVGSPVYRVFKESLNADGDRNFEATDFNCYEHVINNDGVLQTKEGKCAYLKQAVHRFSPTIEGNELVPAIYVGTTEFAAFSETLFRAHDNPQPKPIVMCDVENRYLVDFFLDRELLLCDLSTPYHKGGVYECFDFTPLGSVYSKHSSKSYKRCHEIANAIYQHKDEVDGLFWESRHLPNNFNVVIWNWDGKDTPLVYNPMVGARIELPLFEGNGKYRVLKEAARLNIPAADLM